MIKQFIKTLALEDIAIFSIICTISVASAAYEPTIEELGKTIVLHENGIITNSAYTYDAITKYMPTISSFMSYSRQDALNLGHPEMLVDILNKIGVGVYSRLMNEYVPGFNLGETITRKEFLKILMKLSGKDVTETCEGKFEDVIDDWGCKYIEAGLKFGYLVPDENFRPDDVITKGEILKLITKSQGIPKLFDTGNWKQDYQSSLKEYGIITQEQGNLDEAAMRVWVFTLIADALDVQENTKEKLQEYFISDEAL